MHDNKRTSDCAAEQRTSGEDLDPTAFRTRSTPLLSWPSTGRSEEGSLHLKEWQSWSLVFTLCVKAALRPIN